MSAKCNQNAGNNLKMLDIKIPFGQFYNVQYQLIPIRNIILCRVCQASCLLYTFVQSWYTLFDPFQCTQGIKTRGFIFFLLCLMNAA